MIKFLASDNNETTFLSALRPLIFPAGEAHVTREDRRELAKTEIAVIYGDYGIHNDLFTLKMWADYLDQTPDTRRVLIIPYFPGARMDRGVPFGLKVYVDTIRELNLNTIAIFDPHSQITAEMICDIKGLNVRIGYPEDLFTYYTSVAGYTGVIAPDAGAALRAKSVAEMIGVPVYQATKKREFGSGRLSGFDCEPLPEDGKYILVDDICDRGGTFLGLAKHLGLPPEQLDLYVSHGVFSADAVDTLPTAFGTILTTNSYDPIRRLPDAFVRIDAMTSLTAKALK